MGGDGVKVLNPTHVSFPRIEVSYRSTWFIVQKVRMERVPKVEIYLQNKNIAINSGSTIQGDHILAFWQTQKSGSIPNESIWNTQHSVSHDMHTLF